MLCSTNFLHSSNLSRALYIQLPFGTKFDYFVLMFNSTLEVSFELDLSAFFRIQVYIRTKVRSPGFHEEVFLPVLANAFFSKNNFSHNFKIETVYFRVSKNTYHFWAKCLRDTRGKSCQDLDKVSPFFVAKLG